MNFSAYLLRCSDGSYYAGHTDDLEQRVAQHQAGELSGYTHDRRPVELVWSESFGTREEALAAEQQIKGWSRAKKEALIRSDWQAIRSLASRAMLRDAASTGSAAPQHERNSFVSVRAEEGLSEGEGPSRSTATTQTPPPVIVLVRPQLGQNIGKAARAMLNFGLVEMRLVAPRDGWPNPEAGPAASGADIVLEQAQVFETVADAIADCTNVYATTVRKRGVTKPVVTPVQAADEIWAAPGRSAILFGPERSGLETDDVAVARSILTVPINPEFGSLNLAQAVILVAYEWSKSRQLAQPPAVEIDPPAPQSELDGMIAQLDAMLETAGFFFPPDRTPATKRTLRTMLTKPGWNSQEVRTLRGVLSALANPRRR
ncbi:GIY-YIG nuclease family protein [Sphingomonas sp. CGMCC 1.13654]|uniref:GIY-YIG nuclease family protein n=1 Tax=Sphingomonas chungangi TaxID=2683589 RepID=A0A838L863_9SPHN|nr:TrmH family RNA methyltransferase [Sphingomonas chungangi]MBA2935100.1 GIY-YIG nuclease family protein [Sphingomonas chungangi]MVW54216.1 rRNA methyltransferase [Sphingomonas chungangi]